MMHLPFGATNQKTMLSNIERAPLSERQQAMAKEEMDRSFAIFCELYGQAWAPKIKPADRPSASDKAEPTVPPDSKNLASPAA